MSYTEKDACTLFVSDLPPGTTVPELERIFNTQPGFSTCRTTSAKNGGVVGFVEFTSVEHADNAKHNLEGQLLTNGKPLKVQKSRGRLGATPSGAALFNSMQMAGVPLSTMPSMPHMASVPHFADPNALMRAQPYVPAEDPRMTRAVSIPMDKALYGRTLPAAPDPSALMGDPLVFQAMMSGDPAALSVAMQQAMSKSDRGEAPPNLLQMASTPAVQALCAAPEARPTLYVDNLPLDVTARELGHIFRPFPGFQALRVVIKVGKGKGEDGGSQVGMPSGRKHALCFVEFETVPQAAVAIHMLTGYKMDADDTRGITLSYSKSATENKRPPHSSAGASLLGAGSGTAIATGSPFVTPQMMMMMMSAAAAANTTAAVSASSSTSSSSSSSSTSS